MNILSEHGTAVTHRRGRARVYYRAWDRRRWGSCRWTQSAIVYGTKESVWSSMRHVTPWSQNNSRLCERFCSHVRRGASEHQSIKQHHILSVFKKDTSIRNIHNTPTYHVFLSFYSQKPYSDRISWTPRGVYCTHHRRHLLGHRSEMPHFIWVIKV